MSPSAYITRRRLKPSQQGKARYSYVVRYRLGGRETPLIHGGSFRSPKDARTRRDWIVGELAAMRVPNLRAIAEQAGAPTVAQAARDWLAGRHDLAPASRANYGPALARIEEGLADVRVPELTPRAVNVFVGELVADGIGRTVIDRCMAMLRGTLDDLRDPNPARHRSVKLPTSERVEANPPPFAHWQLILDGVTRATRLPLRVLEGVGLRVGEEMALAWGDIDFPGGRLFVRGGKTPAARRWVPVPPALLDDLDKLVPREDRDPEAPVFPGLLDGTLRMAMRRACRAAAIPLYSPHDLRHRFITLQVRRGMDPAAVAALAGHTRKSLTLDVYSHLLLGEEPA